MFYLCLLLVWRLFVLVVVVLFSLVLVGCGFSYILVYVCWFYVVVFVGFVGVDFGLCVCDMCWVV